MSHDSSPEPDPDDSDSEYIEVDPSGRYGRYKEVLGKGAFKKVYRGFDTLEGIEVAWNQIKVADLLRNSEDLERLYSEVHLLKTLKHKNIIQFYHSWVDTENKNINFVTEIFNSGTLRQYRKKHKRVDLRAVKKWSKQVLEGLFYLHCHDPPVIHRDLKCDNIFVNGNNGEVKIGDLGLAATLGKARSAHSVIGTPEFMAPELYEEEYNELVDIYAFGMCLLELVTFEYPYGECANAAQIYKKVTSGIKPASLAKVNDPGVKAFIEKCIAKVSDRLSAKELLRDHFFHSDEDKVISQSLPPNLNARESTDADAVPKGSRDFTVQGQMKGPNIIILKLRIADSTGHIRNIHFPFDTEVDTELSVASEMVEQLDLTDQDVSTIAEMIASEIRCYIPGWAPIELSRDKANSEVEISDISALNSNKDVSSSKNEFPSPVGNLKMDRLPSGRKYWSNLPIKSGGNSPDNPGPPNLSPERSLTGENEEGDSNNVASLERMEDKHVVDENKKKKQVRVNADLQFVDDNSDANPDRLGGNCDTINNIDSNDIRIVAEKLGHLMVEQAKEIDELKRRNELAVSDLLKELSPETRHIVLSICSQRIDDHKLWCPMECCTGNPTDRSRLCRICKVLNVSCF